MNAKVSDPLGYMSPQDVFATICAIEKRFISLYNISFCSIGFEYEFYCLTNPTDAFLDDISNIDGVHELKNELGNLQFEITTVPQTSCLEACHGMYWVKKSLKSIAKKHNIPISCSAVTFVEGNPPSSMQVSICLHDKNGVMLNAQSKIFTQAVQALVHNLYNATLLMCPTNNCYTRFANLKIAQKFKNSPTHITWGIENRTLAVRIANVPNIIKGHRIECRTPSPMANPYYVVLGILTSMLYVSNVTYPQTFVDAWESPSHRLPLNIVEAYTAFMQSPLLDTIHNFSYQHAV